MEGIVYIAYYDYKVEYPHKARGIFLIIVKMKQYLVLNL
jgi:hypothetical protein